VDRKDAVALKYGLVAFDLDGTLIGADLAISERVRAAVARLIATGTRGCVVTGRMYRAAVPFARALRLDAPLVCYQGAAVVDPMDNAVLRDVPLEPALAQELIARTQADGVHLQLYRNDSYYCEQINRFSDLYARLSDVQPIVVKSLAQTFADRGATKGVVIADPPKAQRYADRLQKEFAGRAYVTRSYPEFVEVLNRNVDKGEALNYVAQRLGVPIEATAAIGDAWNDAPLLRTAGFGIAMGSAPATLREEADAIVGDVASDGVAQAIDEYLLA
jgi:Cof subfamily protein (haloacid dehalogenase superfamily)